MFCASHPVSRESTIRQKAGLQALMQSDGSNFRREAYFQQEHLLLVWKAGTSSRRPGADGTGKFLLLSSQSHGERGSPPRQIACRGVPPSRAASPHCVPALPSLLAPKRAGREKRGFNCRAQREQTRSSGGARSHAAGGDAVLHPLRARGAAAGLARRGARGPRRRRRGRWEMSVRQEEEGGEAELNRARGR